MTQFLQLLAVFILSFAGTFAALQLFAYFERRAAKRISAKAEAERVVPARERLDRVLNRRPRLVVSNDGDEPKGAA